MVEKSYQREVLGLFPDMTVLGGVQASGQVAWERIVEHQNAELQTAHLFSYSSESADNKKNFIHATVSTAKWSAIIKALKTQWTVDHVLVWHLALLKLLPFLRVPEAKVSLFLHGIEAWKEQGWLSRMLLRRVNLFISNSDYTWQRFVQANPWCAQMPHQVVHLGIASPLDGHLPVPGEPPVALMLGRLLKSEDYKGHREMINAWPMVLKHIPEAELWIAGDGDLRAELENLVIAQGLQDKVRFWGRISEEKKQQLLAHCRCLALPSRGEGFGLVYLEAMRMGRPCLVSTIDAGREVVNPPEAGLAVDVTQPHQITEAVCQLLSKGLIWDRWSGQARRRYESCYTGRLFQDRLVSALFPLTQECRYPKAITPYTELAASEIGCPTNNLV